MLRRPTTPEALVEGHAGVILVGSGPSAKHGLVHMGVPNVAISSGILMFPAMQPPAAWVMHDLPITPDRYGWIAMDWWRDDRVLKILPDTLLVRDQLPKMDRGANVFIAPPLPEEMKPCSLVFTVQTLANAGCPSFALLGCDMTAEYPDGRKLSDTEAYNLLEHRQITTMMLTCMDPQPRLYSMSRGLINRLMPSFTGSFEAAIEWPEAALVEEQAPGE